MVEMKEEELPLPFEKHEFKTQVRSWAAASL
jgi:hypothetical protein